MPVYVYEPITSDSASPPPRWEFRQGINEPPLTQHPETGAPIRRVISGGIGFRTGAGTSDTPMPSGGCGPSCGCV